MSVAVVVGPAAVRGPYAVDVELTSVALECIDDDVALLDSCVVPTEQVWRDVVVAATGGRSDEVVLVFPSWWPDGRIARVEAAARDVVADVGVVRRIEVFAADLAVVEVAPECVVVHRDTRRYAVPRTGADERVVAAVVAHLDGLDAVTVDVPTGSALFGAELSRALRLRGVDATVLDDYDVGRRAQSQFAYAAPADASGHGGRHLTPPRVALTAAALSVVVLLTAALWVDTAPARTVGTTWLVEGRVAVEVPTNWRVERITSGPGSARVQVNSPLDGSAAIHLVQARTPTETLGATAEQLRGALAAEGAGVFVDFNAAALAAERPVVTYREVRADRQVRWTAWLDRGVRIAIGCQGPVDSPGPERDCDRAIGSAHTVA